MLPRVTYLDLEIEILYCYCSACKFKHFTGLISILNLPYTELLDSFLLVRPVDQKRRQLAVKFYSE